MVHFVDNS